MALAMINVIVNEKLHDSEFIDKYTFGFDKLVPHIQKYTPEWAEKITWVAADDIRKLARLFAGTRGAGIYQGTCTQDQTANGTQNSRAFCVLQIITGNINIPGGWVISPRLPWEMWAWVSKESHWAQISTPSFMRCGGGRAHTAWLPASPKAFPTKSRHSLSLGQSDFVHGRFERLQGSIQKARPPCCP